MLFRTLRKLYSLLDGHARRNALLVFAMMLVLGLLEAAGVASIMPFIAVVMQPSIVQSNTYLVALYERLAFSNTNSFLFFLAVAVFVVVVGRIFFAALTQYAILRYTSALSYSLTTRLLKKYLGQPYVWFLHHHSSDLGKSILSEVDEVINGSLIPGLQLLTRTVVIISVLAVLIAAAPKIAISVILMLGGAYAAIYQGVGRHLRRSGHDRFAANRERTRIAHDVLAGIKEVKVMGLETVYLQKFRTSADRVARRKATGRMIGQLPQYIFEGLAHGGMLIVVMVLLAWSQDDLSKVLPIVGLYAFAGLRALPALQAIYLNLTNISFGQTGLDVLHADLAMSSGTDAAPSPRDDTRWPLRKYLELRDVTYAYPRSGRPALVDITLSIPARTTVGFVGATGAGKTTVVDVILGLLEPLQGEVLVDGTPIRRHNVRSWQRAIGYVPQHIFLVSDTVVANIAFGVPPHKVDMQAVERAGRYAKLHDFVTDELGGYQTIIGERGVRLSGGQRQRIAIARALYHDPDVLVLDEATSSLDNLTERAIMDAIHNLAHVKTILLIAHRLSTVRACDRIFFLAHGRLQAAGTFDELLARNANFEKLAMPAG